MRRLTGWRTWQRLLQYPQLTINTGAEPYKDLYWPVATTKNAVTGEEEMRTCRDLNTHLRRCVDGKL